MEGHRRELLAAATEIEMQHRDEFSAAAQRNERVLRRSKPGVSDEMWTAIGFAGGTSGLVALAGWTDPSDTEIDSKLDQLREVYQAALENRSVEARGM